MKSIFAFLLVAFFSCSAYAEVLTETYGSSSGGGTIRVTAATPNVVINPSPGTGTFTVGGTNQINAQGSATTYTILSTDMEMTVTHNSSSAVAVTLPQAGTTGFEAGDSYTEINTGSAPVTITPTTSTINGAATLVLLQNQGAYIISDGTNWFALVGGAFINPVLTAPRAVLQTISISTATFTPNFNTGSDFLVTLNHAACPCTLANPSTTPVVGQHGVIYVVQSATGSDSIGTWGSDYVTAGGTSAITLSTDANAIDVFLYTVKDSTHIVLSPAWLHVVH